MQETRRARLQAVIQEELSVVVAREVKDPRIPFLTFTKVEVTPDASLATVFVTILGGLHAVHGAEGANEATSELDEAAASKRMKDALAGLTSASGYLRRHLARVLTIRHVPQLVFKEDRGLANTARVHQLLKKISDKDEGTP